MRHVKVISRLVALSLMVGSIPSTLAQNSTAEVEAHNTFGSGFGNNAPGGGSNGGGNGGGDPGSGTQPQPSPTPATFEAAFEVGANGKQVKQDCAVCHWLEVYVNGKKLDYGETITLRKDKSHEVTVQDNPQTRGSPPQGATPPHDDTQTFTVFPKAVGNQTITEIPGDGPNDPPKAFIVNKDEVLDFLIDNSEKLLAMDKEWPTNAADEPMKKKAKLLPVDIRTPSIPYSDGSTPAGPVNNIVSVWPDDTIELLVDLSGVLTESTLPPNTITWSAPGIAVAANTMNATLSWSTSGTRQIEITIGESRKHVAIDVPDVGSLSASTAAAIDPFGAANALLYANLAANWAASVHTDDDRDHTEPGKANALQHSYWNALMASDILLGPAKALFFSTAHEFTGRAGGAVAFDSTMDLHNNFIGSLVSHTSHLGVGDQSAIKSELLSRLSAGDLWIVASGPLSFSSGVSNGEIGHVIKSNGNKIFPVD